MSNNTTHSRVFDVSMFLLTVFVASLTAIFVIQYCSLFDDFGLMAKARLIENPLITFIVTPVLFWLSAYLCRAYSPNASGNYLYAAIQNLKNHPGNFEKAAPFLNIRLVMIKAFSSLIASFGGGALGKEGPSVHMSAGIFATLAERYKKYLPHIGLESWVMAGTATGLAIAFNAPIAGIVFVIEKLSKNKFENFKSHIIWTITIIAITTLLFYRPDPLFKFHNLDFSKTGESFLLVLIAFFCGFLAFFFQTTNNYLYTKVANIKTNWWHLVPILAGLTVAYLNFFCGIYSFSGGITTAQETLSSATPLLSYKEVGGRILNTIISFASGCAGGLIAPAMAIGAGIGSIFYSLVPDFEIGIFLLIGMTAFLAAVLGEPITAAIVIFEATGQNSSNIPFLLGAAFISLFVSKGTEKLTKFVRSNSGKLFDLRKKRL